MKLRTLVLSVAILAVLSAGAFLLQRPSAPADRDARIGQSVFDAKILDRTSRIRLADQGKTVLLTKQADGKWIDASYFDLPADFSKLSRFIDDLASAKIQRRVTRNPETLARLDFKDTSIALLDSADKDLWRLTLGKNAEGGGRFVKFGTEAAAYQANLSLFLDSEAKNWADSLLVDLKPDDVAQVEVGFAEGEPVTATRAKKDDAWTAAKAPAGQRLKSDRITSLLGSFTNLRFQDTSDLNDANVAAARQHSRTLKLTTFDHQTITIQLGRKPEEKKPEVSGQKPEARAQKPEAESQKPEAGSPLAAAAATSSPEPSPSAAPSAKAPTTADAPAKAETPKPESPAAPAPAAAAPPAKPVEPKVETIPAGPVYAFITSSDPAAPINALMKKRAFQIYDWNFTSLPQKPDELFEPLPPPPATETKPAAKPTEAKPPASAPGAKPIESKPAETEAPTTPAAPAASETKPAAETAKP
ncbi:MAG TPA: DUF4340 domain-containing protein [Opitutaceae bacterium]|nr:DUF4340 domain-containing protein [Opitutaceae bacterium]